MTINSIEELIDAIADKRDINWSDVKVEHKYIRLLPHLRTLDKIQKLDDAPNIFYERMNALMEERKKK